MGRTRCQAGVPSHDSSLETEAYQGPVLPECGACQAEDDAEGRVWWDTRVWQVNWGLGERKREFQKSHAHCPGTHSEPGSKPFLCIIAINADTQPKRYVRL